MNRVAITFVSHTTSKLNRLDEALALWNSTATKLQLEVTRSRHEYLDFAPWMTISVRSESPKLTVESNTS